MATLEIFLGLGMPDSSGDVYPSTVEIAADLTNAKQIPCMVYEWPTGSDIGVELGFKVPQNYVGTPKLVICGVISTTEAQTLAFAAQTEADSIDDSVTFDVAYGAEDTVSQANLSGNGYADEDYMELAITLTPATGYVAGEWVNVKVVRDDSVDTCTTVLFCCTGLYFQYADA
jgi:hypothetical protein